MRVVPSHPLDALLDLLGPQQSSRQLQMLAVDFILCVTASADDSFADAMLCVIAEYSPTSPHYSPTSPGDTRPACRSMTALLIVCHCHAEALVGLPNNNVH